MVLVRTALILMAVTSVYAMISSCGESGQNNGKQGNEITGKNVYNKYCRVCHGEDGKKGLGGAGDLTVTLLNDEKTAQIIRYGRGNMAGFNSVLSEKETQLLVEYVKKLKDSK